MTVYNAPWGFKYSCTGAVGSRPETWWFADSLDAVWQGALAALVSSSTAQAPMMHIYTSTHAYDASWCVPECFESQALIWLVLFLAVDTGLGNLKTEVLPWKQGPESVGSRGLTFSLNLSLMYFRLASWMLKLAHALLCVNLTLIACPQYYTSPCVYINTKY